MVKCLGIPRKVACVGYRKFKSNVGTSPVVCVAAWDNLDSVRPPKSEPKHLLWVLLHLNQYCTEHVNTTLVRVTEKTFLSSCKNASGKQK